ncbi:MAG: hypothetical protein Fur0042_10490 [Cyanophyceae cyanobacterium]
MRSPFLRGISSALSFISRQAVQILLGTLLGLSLVWLLTYWIVGALTYRAMAQP